MSWAEISIGDIGKIITGDTPPRKNTEYYGSAYPFIKPTDMKIGQRLTTTYEEGYSEDGFEKYRNKLIPTGSTAVVTIGSIGQKLTWLHTDSFVNQAVNAVVPNQDKFDSLYIYYLLKHNLNLVKQADTGASSGRENVSKSNFSALKIWACLDLNTQKQIAEILDALDSSIETNQRRIALLEDAARRLYREWFVHLRFPGHESVPVQDGVPQGWTTDAISAFGKIETGKTPPTSDIGLFGGDVPFIKTPDMHGRMVTNSATQTLSEFGSDSQKKKLLPAGSLLVSCIGTVGVVSIAGKPSHTNQQINAVIPYEDFYCTYLYFALSDLKEYMLGLGGGSTMANISKSKFSNLSILKPGNEILKKFEDIVVPSVSQIETLDLQNRELAQARDLLLPKLMSGQLDVSHIPLPQAPAP